MLDHVSFSVPPAQFDSLVAWYVAALAPLGYGKQVEYAGKAVGFGPDKTQTRFWIGAKEEAPKGASLHLAFKAKDHAAVDRFYDEALKAGGTSNGGPGLRPHYHPNYYAAFVLDPVGCVLRAACCVRLLAVVLTKAQE
jgi:catechol 2,3-dioxygenase-like lactoylglutathione lyase family enzyme